jgi:hypothetical protein
MQDRSIRQVEGQDPRRSGHRLDPDLTLGALVLARPAGDGPAYGAGSPRWISAWPVICPPRNTYVATHWASARATEVTVETPAWCPTSVSPLSSWLVNTRSAAISAQPFQGA